MSKQGRGELSPRVSKLAKKLMCREIDVVELRLMAYLHYVMVNNQHIDPDKVNGEEWEIMIKWVAEKRMAEDTEGKKLKITKEFWDTLSEIIYLAYVDL